MIGGFTFLLACQLAGEAVSRGLSLPVPGPVLGLTFLLLGLAILTRFGRWDRARLDASGVARVSDGLLGSLALLFVPAGIGVVQHLDLIGSHGVAIAAALVGSTLATLVVTVATFLGVKRLTARRDGARRP